ncbi:MAG: branched-chain amino acid ABC transporter permease, partial [Rhodobacteraceae bacterium]|nr:branched-chain amino acid ABC transporter permease [Paracoccaceae bacterium]
MSDTVLFALEAALNGLTVGIMYSLVALGFVLIFKASGIFNFAQGVMALFAALTLVGFQQGQVPFAPLFNALLGTSIHEFGWTLPSLLAIVLTVAVMVALAWLIERLVLKHLVNQEPIILFMATIGLSYFLEGLGDIMWGAEVKRLDVGIPQGMSAWVDEVTYNLLGYGFYLDTLNLWALVIAGVLVTALVLFSQYTKQG